MKPNEEVKHLSGKYGIRVKRMKIVHNGVYKIVTRGGKEYCLKRMSYPPSRLRWIDKTMLRLKRRGFRKIVWRNPGESYGKRLYVKRFRDSPPFVLHPWIKGSWPSPRSKSHMKACGSLLAVFHRAGGSISVPVKGRNNALGSWTAYFREEQNQLRLAVRKALRKGFRSPLDGLLRKYGPAAVSMGKTALSALRKSKYRSLCRKSKAALCHGDFGPTNIIRTSKGMYLIDFETLRVDLRAYDLYRLIFNTGKENGWNFAVVKAILDGYQKVARLKRSDYQMLKLLLRYPRGVCMLIAHYDKKPAGERNLIHRQFPRIIAEERKKKAAIKKLDAYAKKHIGLG